MLLTLVQLSEATKKKKTSAPIVLVTFAYCIPTNRNKLNVSGCINVCACVSVYILKSINLVEDYYDYCDITGLQYKYIFYKNICFKHL